MTTTKMHTIKVRSMTGRSGNAVANQFMIITDDGVFFQSYDSVIAYIPYSNNEKTLLDKRYWDYSRTTSKYLAQFLAKSTQEIKKNIESGEYLLADLNG